MVGDGPPAANGAAPEADAGAGPAAGQEDTYAGGAPASPFSANAPEFVPAFLRTDNDDPTDLKKRLPESHRAMLRQVYQAMTGEMVAYYVGRLKSFNNRTGYGFLECEQAKKDWGADVFIHKNLVPNPWQIGQYLEFAVSVNNRGQPQARDVSWLPPLEPSSGRPAAAPGQPGGAAGVPGAAPGADAARSSSANPWEVQVPQVPQEFLGTVKSFSPAQGYGFLTHDEGSPDVYFDRATLPPAMIPRPGQLVTYSVNVNARGQNQAKNIEWNPVPHLPEAGPVEPGRRYRPEVLFKLRKLLFLHRSGEIEKMVIMAIDNAGRPGMGQQDASGEVDYATFVLDHLGGRPPPPGVIKDFVKMLMLLMLAKMMKNQMNRGRCQKLITWFEVISYEIDPSGDDIKDHFGGVVDQASSDLKIATRENPHVREDTGLMAAFQHLQEKAQMLKSQRLAPQQ